MQKNPCFTILAALGMACVLTACTAEQLSLLSSALGSTTSSGKVGVNAALEDGLAQIQKLQDEIMAKNYVIIGRVQASGEVDEVENITLTVPFNNKLYSTQTDARGAFELHLPKGSEYPDYVGVLVKGPGIQTQVVNLKGNTHQTGVGITVAPKAYQEAYLEDENLYHLGDGNYSGAINSQFQYPDASGTSRSVTINLSEEAANQSRLGMSIAIRGYENSGSKQGLYVNDKLWVTYGNSDSDGSFMVFSGNMETRGLFQAGPNVITFRSDQNASGDYDDFEYMNLMITSPWR